MKKTHIIEVECDCAEQNKKEIERIKKDFSKEIHDTRIELFRIKTDTKLEIQEIIDRNKPFVQGLREWLVAKGLLKVNKRDFAKED